MNNELKENIPSNVFDTPESIEELLKIETDGDISQYVVERHNDAIKDALTSTSLGYVLYMGPFDEYKSYKHACAFEYCIETFPLEDSERSCPIFGHSCPAGVRQVQVCVECDELAIGVYNRCIQ